jgi:hypothetical protein
LVFLVVVVAFWIVVVGVRCGVRLVVVAVGIVVAAAPG